jgi:hypothetical protein
MHDYRYLKERGFPDKAALKLVGDRYRLSRTGRNCLFRGVIVGAVADSRSRKSVSSHEVEGNALGVDWYNVLITVESHLRGTVLFIADDGLLRDSSAAHGSYRRSALTERAVQEILSAVRSLRPRRVDAFLDSPIAHSASMAEELRSLLGGIPGLGVKVDLAHTADFPLKTYEGIVATSDSVILDSSTRVFDLARFALERGFGFTPLPLQELARRFPEGPERLFESETPGP